MHPRALACERQHRLLGLGQRAGAGFPQAAGVLAAGAEHQLEELGRELVMLLVGLRRQLRDRAASHQRDQLLAAGGLCAHASLRLAPLTCPGAVARAGAQQRIWRQAVRQRQVEQAVAQRRHRVARRLPDGSAATVRLSAATPRARRDAGTTGRHTCRSAPRGSISTSGSPRPQRSQASRPTSSGWVVALEMDERALRRGLELIEGTWPLALLAEADAGLLERFDDPADVVDLVDLEADVVWQLALSEAGKRAVLGLCAEDLAGVACQGGLARLGERGDRDQVGVDELCLGVLDRREHG